MKNNLIITKNRFPEIYSLLETIGGDSSIEIVKTKQGDCVPLVTQNGKKLAVHSKFDPYKEAERFIGDMHMDEYDVLFVFGFGFGYHISEVLKSMSRDAVLVVVEKNIHMLKAALENRELDAILSDKRLSLLIDPDENKLSETLKGRSSSNVSFLTHRGSFSLYPDYYQNALGIAKTYISTKAVNIATLLKFEKTWSSNIARNIRQFLTSPGINVFSGAFKDVPALIVCAGPSLIENIDYIKTNRDRMVVIAVDTALKILLKHGIEPHFCVAVDPQVINARYFEGVTAGKTVLVTDPTVHPSVFHLFKGRSVTTGVAFDLMKWIEKIGGEKGSIAHGGSVSTNAYDFARQLGCAPLVMTGQDLAFTNGYAHCKGSYLEEQLNYKSSRTFTLEMFNYRQLTALPKIYVKGINGGKVHTNQKMMIFINWFEKQQDNNLVNATPAGASIPKVRHVPLEQVEPATHVDIAGKIDAVLNSFNTTDAAGWEGSMSKRITLMLSETESLIPVLQRAVGMAETLVASLGSQSIDQQKVNYILQKLAETDKIVESRKNIKDTMSITIQKVIHTIKEGYDIDEEDKSMDDETLIAKRSHYLYKGLLEGALFSRKVLNKMLRVIERA